MKSLSLFVILVSFPLAAFAQGPQKSPLDPTHWGVVYDIPETKRVTVKSGVSYFKDAASDLQIDIYSPAAAKSSGKLPTIPCAAMSRGQLL